MDPGVLNDPFFRGGLSMGNPKIAAAPTLSPLDSFS
jgi:hypothetical protein